MIAKIPRKKFLVLTEYKLALEYRVPANVCRYVSQNLSYNEIYRISLLLLFRKNAN